jgi:hypothetical protein
MKTIAEREALYRFLGNEQVALDDLLAPHVQQTVKRAATLRSPPLAIIDKTQFCFPGEASREGLDSLGPKGHGFEAFCVLAVSPDRTPLGVLAIQPVAANAGRAGAAAWEAPIEEASKHLEGLDPVFVIDREADTYALFARLRARQRRFVVRVAADRLVKEDEGSAKEMLREIAARAPVTVERTVKLSRRSAKGRPPGARKRHPPREGRDAVLAVRACSITLPRPRKLSDPDLPESLQIGLVQVIEANPPPGEQAVEWLIFTNLPLDNASAIEFVVDAYRARWTIEEFFKALKTGCSYEKRQLESKAALLNALGLLAPLAWRLLALKSAARADAAASSVLTETELHVLRRISEDAELGPTPTASEALYAIALLGGHFPQNGNPGWMVIWSGFQMLRERVQGYLIAKAEK